MIERWKGDFVPVMEKFFRMAEGMDADTVIERMTQIPGLPFSVKAIRAGDTIGQGSVMTGTKEGNLKNPGLRKLGAANSFTGSAEGYHIDMRDIIAETLRDRVSLATKAEMYRTLVSEGVAQWSRRGDHIEGFKEIPGVNPPRGTQTAEMGETSLYVKNEAYSEVRKALKVDQPWSKVPGANLATTASLMSIVEATTHAKNLGTAVFNPGVHPVEIVQNAWKTFTKDPATMSRLIDLAEIGATKSHGMESTPKEGILGKASEFIHQGGLANPINWTGKFLEVVDQTMRLSMDQAFDRLARQGRVQPTEGNKRDFINQALGQYHKAGQNSVVALLRETGIGPFATAGTTYAAQGVKALMADPGVTATSYKQALGLRAEKIARMAVVLSVAPIVNYMMWKRWDGDENTPIGALKVGTDKNGKTEYFDLAAFTGVRRGARLVGLNALAEGTRAGDSGRGILSRAADQTFQGVLHPAEGPIVQTATILASGRNTIGIPLTEHRDDFPSRMQAAIWNANPVVAVATGSDVAPRADGSRDTDFWEQFSKAFGPLGIKRSSRPPGAPRGNGALGSIFR